MRVTAGCRDLCVTKQSLAPSTDTIHGVKSGNGRRNHPVLALECLGESIKACRIASQAVHHEDGAGTTTTVDVPPRGVRQVGCFERMCPTKALVMRLFLLRRFGAGSTLARGNHAFADYGIRSLCRVRLLIFQPSDVFTKTSS